ncbi:hypothetical protein CF161_29213, partial [Pseudomonas sp. CF161]
ERGRGLGLGWSGWLWRCRGELFGWWCWGIWCGSWFVALARAFFEVRELAVARALAMVKELVVARELAPAGARSGPKTCASGLWVYISIAAGVAAMGSALTFGTAPK